MIIYLIKQFKKKGLIDIEEKYYTCKYDRVFKDIFLDKNDTSLLKGLLESILKIEIKTITIQNNELREGNAYLRRKHLDALLETNKEIINIEINSSIDNYIKVRNFAFLSKVYANHTLRGKSYNKDEKFIQINFSYGLNDQKLFRIYKIQDNENITFIDNIEIYEFNMDNYLEFWYTDDKEKIKENKYLIMMNLSKKELEKFSKEDKVVKEYMNKLNRINEDPAFLNIIDYEEDNIRIMNSIKEVAEEKGLKEGREKGLIEGREKGLIEGRVEGKKEGISLVAKNLLKRNTPIEEIKEITGLTKEEIEKLKVKVN